MVVSSKLAFDYPNCTGGLYSAGEIERECEKSLRRLQTDRIDLYYSHRDDRETRLGETMKAFDRLISSCGQDPRDWRQQSSRVAHRASERDCPSQWLEPVFGSGTALYLLSFRNRHGADFGPQIFLTEDLKDYARFEGIALIGYSVLLQGAYTRTPVGSSRTVRRPGFGRSSACPQRGRRRSRAYRERSAYRLAAPK